MERFANVLRIVSRLEIDDTDSDEKALLKRHLQHGNISTHRDKLYKKHLKMLEEKKAVRRREWVRTVFKKCASWSLALLVLVTVAGNLYVFVLVGDLTQAAPPSVAEPLKPTVQDSATAGLILKNETAVCPNGFTVAMNQRTAYCLLDGG